jgi:glycerol uptake facilitator-like aquaporin
MKAAAGRRLLAEFTGTGPLVAVVVGSGIAATRLTTDGALRLVVNSVVTALGLAAAVMACQTARAIAGAALADAMFAESILSPPHHHRGGAPILLSEVVATARLPFVIVALVRTGRVQHVAWAVGAWIGAASAARSARSWPSPFTRPGPARSAPRNPPSSQAEPGRHAHGRHP